MPKTNQPTEKKKKNPPAMQEAQFNSLGGNICWRRDMLPTPVFLGFPYVSVGKEFCYND